MIFFFFACRPRSDGFICTLMNLVIFCYHLSAILFLLLKYDLFTRCHLSLILIFKLILQLPLHKKVLFGGMFRDWLQEYSHWGWFDTDIIFGDLSSALRPYLDSADVVTFPDGVLNALYLSGQLTIFRNNDFFRTCFVAG